MMKIIVSINNQASPWKKALPSPKKTIQKIAETVLNELNLQKFCRNVEISVLLTNNAEIQKLNKNFRQKDKATNVLSFPTQEIDPDNLATISSDNGYLYLGDIALAYETIAKEAQEENKNMLDHFIHLMVHSILHLLGHDHQEIVEAKKMQQLEIALLAIIGIKSPYNNEVLEEQ